MKCPKCKTEDLYPAKLESDLPAMGCRRCDGALVSLLYYRDWVERTTLSLTVDVPGSVESVAGDTKSALTCPKCARLMTKYLITGNQDNRIDLCGSCDEAWLDGGEWTLLKSLDLAKMLPSVFTDQWQKRVRKDVTEQQRFKRLQNVVGNSEAERAQEVAVWLKASPNRSTILHYLNSD